MDTKRTVATSITTQVVTRREASGRRGMVTAKHPAAAEAGLRVLESGGNAVDAAVATAFAVAVAEPMSSGLGGGGFMTVRLADGREAIVDYQVRAPGAAHETMYTLTPSFHADGQGFVGVADDANFSGPRSTAVPGLVAGLATAATTFGTLPLSQLIEHAIALAEEGVTVEWPLMLSQASRLSLLRRFPVTAATYLKDGCPLTPGEEGDARLRQPDLAGTLRLIAREGPDGFYRGAVARAIDAEMRHAGGHLAAADLERYQAKLVQPLIGSFHGDRLVALHGPASGSLMLETFNILEGLPLAEAGYLAVDALHLTIEAMRRSHADRLAFLGDPEFQEVPWDALISKEYARVRRETIDRERHAPAFPGDPWSFMPGGSRAPVPAAVFGREDHTTHLSVVDGAGNAVAVTQTLTSGWGCGVTVPGTGVLLNNAMTLFDPRPGTANSIAPWKRPASSMAHTIVVRGGEVVLVAGAPGGRKILDTVTQVLLSVLAHGRGIQDAVSGPFLDTSAARTQIDERVPEEVRRGLAARGHDLLPRAHGVLPSFFARPAGIARDPSTGELRGGADPYHHGVASGY